MKRWAGKKNDSSAIVERMLDRAVSVRIVSEITNYAATLIDAILIASMLGVDAVAAYGLAGPAFVFLPAIGGTIANGVNRLCGNSIGSGDLATTNRAFSSSLIGGLALSAIPTLVFLLFPSQLSAVLGATGTAADLQAQIGEYLRGLAVGTPAFVLLLVLMPFLQFNGDHALLTAAVFGMSVLDIVFDLISVFVFRGGLFGMALASSLSYWFAALLMGSSFLKKKMIRFSFRDWDARLFGGILSQGIPYVLRQGCGLVRSLGVNHVVVHFLPAGTLPVYSIVTSLQKLIYTPGSAIGDGTLLVSSMMYGEDDRQALGRTLKEGARLSLFLNGAVILVGAVYAPRIARLYLGSDPTLLEPAVLGLRLAVLSSIPYSLQMMYRSYLQGISRRSEVLTATVLNELILSLLCAAGLSLLFSVNGFWLSFTVQEILTILVMGVMVLIRRKGNRTDRGETILMLPDAFGAAQEDRIFCRVENAEDVLRFSEQVRQFCLGRETDPRTAGILALCVEEIGINILRFGMKDREEHCEILLWASRGTWNLRFRDDCDAFDPVAYLESFVPSETEARFGLRLALSLAEEAVYVRSMNINNLRIRLTGQNGEARIPG